MASGIFHVFPLDLGRDAVRVEQHGDLGDLWQQLAQQLQSLPSELGGVDAHPRGIAARPIDAGSEPFLDRIEAGDEENGNRGGRGLRRLCCDQTAGRGDHGDLEADQLGRQGMQSFILTLRHRYSMTTLRPST